MREIKFRLRDHNEIVGYEKWYSGSWSPEGYWIARPCWLYSKDGESWNPTPISYTDKDQFTDLKDYKQKEIYEGDIVDCDAFTDVVIFKLGIFTTERSGHSDNTPQGLWEHGRLNLEVIGNIYDNPELLGERRR